MTASNGAVVSEEHKNFFSSLPHLWPQVDADGKIDAVQFLNAATGIIDFFGLVGKVFNPIKYDISGNIEKLRKKHAMDPERFKFLNDMILIEKENGEQYAIESLLWLKRALEFVSIFLWCVVEDHESGGKAESLVPFSQKAYEASLKKYHSWMVQKLHQVNDLRLCQMGIGPTQGKSFLGCFLQLLSRALPWRKDFMRTLAGGKDGMEDIVIHHMKEFLAGMDRNIAVIVELYRIHDLESDAVV